MDIKTLSSIAPTRQDPAGQTARGSGVSSPVTTDPTATGADTTQATRLIYTSPFAQYDPQTHLEILQFRDVTTGKVQLQIPTEKVVEAYRRIAAYGKAGSADDPQAATPTPDTPRPAASDRGAGDSAAPKPIGDGTATTPDGPPTPSEFAAALVSPSLTVAPTPAPPPQPVAVTVPVPKAPVTAPSAPPVYA